MYDRHIHIYIHICICVCILVCGCMYLRITVYTYPSICKRNLNAGALICLVGYFYFDFPSGHVQARLIGIHLSQPVVTHLAFTSLHTIAACRHGPIMVSYQETDSRTVVADTAGFDDENSRSKKAGTGASAAHRPRTCHLRAWVSTMVTCTEFC